MPKLPTLCSRNYRAKCNTTLSRALEAFCDVQSPATVVALQGRPLLPSPGISLYPVRSTLLEVLPHRQLGTELILLLYCAVEPSLMCFTVTYLILYALPYKGPRRWVLEEVYQYFICKCWIL